MVREAIWIWLGFAYGCVLFVFAFGSAGMGHGSYLPFAIYGAPLSILPVAGMFIAPVWWAAVGTMLSLRRNKMVATLLILHAITVGLVLWLGTPMEPGDEQWRYFSVVEPLRPAWLWGGMATYLIGQLVAWWATVAMANRVCQTGS